LRESRTREQTPHASAPHATEHEGRPVLVESRATRGLEVLGGLRAAPAARHPLYDLDVLAVFVLILEAQVHPAS
jgi:hypothetical protein